MTTSTLNSFYTVSEVNEIIVSKIQKRFSVDEFKEILIDMKRFAIEKSKNKLLIDATGINFHDLTMSERHDIGLAAAEILKGDFKGVCVIQKQFINKHGENVANNRGADAFVTDNLDEATNWLLR